MANMKKLTKNRVYGALLAGNIFILAVGWAFSAWRYAHAEEFIPIHYTIYFGFDRFGPKIDLFVYPILATVLCIINGALMYTVFRAHMLWKMIVLGLLLFFQALLFTSLFLAVLSSVH